MIKVGEVYEKDAKTIKQSEFKGLVGTLVHLRIGESAIIDDIDFGKKRGCFRTSKVESFEETDGGLWIYTKNNVYRLDNV
jgi:hypothetical protein